MEKEFPTGAILSVTTGLMVCREGFTKIHALMEHLAEMPLWTHQLPRAWEGCRQALYAQHPGLRCIHPPKPPVEEAWQEWLACQEAALGKAFLVAPAPGCVECREPVGELSEMLGPDQKMIVVRT